MNDTQLVLDKTQELLDQLGCEAQPSVEFESETGYYQIQLDTESPGLLIGYRGETLTALQLYLGLLVNQNQAKSSEEADWKKVVVNVGDYRQRREETLTQLAKNAAQRVVFSGEPYVFDRLSPNERRIVHLALKDNDKVSTYSEGEGKYRKLIVVLK